MATKRNFGLKTRMGAEYRPQDWRFSRRQTLPGSLEPSRPALVPLWHDLAAFGLLVAVGAFWWGVLLWVWP